MCCNMLNTNIIVWHAPMSDIPYLRIRVIYLLRPCALGFGLRSVRDVYSLKMVLGVFSIFMVGYCFTV